jgi:hypothetical protein
MVDGLNSYQSINYWRSGNGHAVSRTMKSAQDMEAPFLNLWGDKALAWGARNGLGEAADRLIGLSTPVRTQTEANLFEAMGFEYAQPKALMTYGSMLKLGDQSLAWRDLTWENYTSRVKKNTAGLFRALAPEARRSFFQGVTLKSYLREVVWEGNVKPFKDLAAGGSEFKLGSSVAGVAGIGLLGWGILSNTYQAYQNAKAQEDGTHESKWQTWRATGAAFFGQAIKSLAAWEVAGLGFAVGKAIIPIGTFPIGGILVGALLASVVYRLLSKALPDPPRHDQGA